jgi:indolepyruvate ferredoxin oxidoreductase, beta subunit
MNSYNLIICGVGGQGNILLEKILGLTAIHDGYEVRAADTFGAAQRGGGVTSHIRIGKHVCTSIVPQKACQILLGLEPLETLRVAMEYIAPNGIIIFNTAPVFPPFSKGSNVSYPSIDTLITGMKRLTSRTIALNATKLSKEASGNVRSMNITMLGALIGTQILSLRKRTVAKIIMDISPNYGEVNLKAFEAGWIEGERRKDIVKAIIQ